MALIKKIIFFILLSSFAYAETADEMPTYSLVSTQVLEEVCRNGWCVNTTKKEFISSDGFLFETYLTDGTDSVWCLGYSKPCSTRGDTGGGKNEMIIHNVKNKQKVKIVNNSPAGDGRITRVEIPLEYKFIIIEIYSGGASCCSIFEFYSKDDLSLNPFIIENPVEEARFDYDGLLLSNGYLLVSENTIEVELMKEYPDDSYYCSLAARPYDKYQITLTPTGYESKLIELREWPSECKGSWWPLWLRLGLFE